jgi:hypothetical protein
MPQKIYSSLYFAEILGKVHDTADGDSVVSETTLMRDERCLVALIRIRRLYQTMKGENLLSLFNGRYFKNMHTVNIITP